jgi:hypothetical protein
MLHAHFAWLAADWISIHLASDPTVKKSGQSDQTVVSAASNMTQIELSVTKVTLALAPNPSILDKPRPPPLRLWSLPASRVFQQWTSALHSIYAVPPPAVVADELTPSK